MSGGEIPREQFGFGNWKNRHVLAIGGIRSCEVGVESDSNQHCGESVDESVDYGKNFKAVPGSIRLFARLRSVSPSRIRSASTRFFFTVALALAKPT